MFTSLNEIYDIGKEMNFLSAFNDWGNAALVSSEEEDADDDNGDGEGDDDDFPFDNDDGGRFRLSRDEVLKGVLIHEPGDEYQSGEEESHDPSVIETLHQSRNPLNHPQGQFGEGREGHSRNPLNHQQGQFGEGREGHSRNPLNHQQGQFGEGREDHSKNPLNHQQGQFGEGGEGHSRNALNHPQGQFEEGREDDSRNPSSQKKHQVENNQEDVSRKQVHHPQRQLMNFGSSKEVGEPIKANDVPPCNRKTKVFKSQPIKLSDTYKPPECNQKPKADSVVSQIHEVSDATPTPSNLVSYASTLQTSVFTCLLVFLSLLRA
ncbi:hypothetical protein HMI56_006705 [Coelomomyces lativittatus]|nr:hypothetical protein HMI56_006705 [Coelomomyces lativittatus]